LKNNDFKRMFLALTALLGVFLPGCASAPRQSAGTFSDRAVLLDVGFVRQGDPNLCGVAVLGMLTQYYGKPIPAQVLKALEKEAAEKKGIKGASLEGAFKQAGYHVAIFRGALDKRSKGLYHHLDLKRPLVVMLSPEGAKENHYQLVSGYDPKNGLISLLDPAKGPLAMPVASFKASWERANSFTLLAVPAEGDTSR